MYTFICICLYVYVHAYVFVYGYVYVHVHVDVDVHIDTYSHGIHAIVSNSANKIPTRTDPKMIPKFLREAEGSRSRRGLARPGKGRPHESATLLLEYAGIHFYIHAYKHTKIHRYYMIMGVYICILYIYISLHM